MCETAKVEELPAFIHKRFPQAPASVDGVLCWDLIDYLDRPAAQALAEEVTRVLRPDGALLGFFGTAQPRDTRYTKYIVIDEVNLKHQSYQAARGRQAILLNRDILRLFSGLRVSDSFLLQNNLREILFRKPVVSSLRRVSFQHEGTKITRHTKNYFVLVLNSCSSCSSWLRDKAGLCIS